MNVLVVDDDREIVDSISIFLSGEGYKALKAYDGIEALDILSENEVHLMILDIMMPKLDGIKTLMKLRESRNIPVILLSAKSEDTDKIFGLTAGADDYVTKPFNPSELMARVKSQLRRYTTLGSIGKQNGEIVIDGLSVNTESKTVKVDGENVRLTPVEYKILELLVRNRGRVFSAEDIYSNVWNEQNIVGDNTIAVHVRHIREKIEINPKEPKYLKVVWGIGYKIPELKCDDMKTLAGNINDIAIGLDESVAAKVKAERLKTELITNVSHDLKTPITSIISYTELLSKIEDLPEEAKDYVAVIAKKSDRLKRLTQDLFDISKVQSGNDDVVLEKLDVALLINQALGEHDNEIQSSGLPFCVEAPKELFISADGRKMSRVLSNLINNILKYAMKNTRVFITASEKNDMIEMEFKNISAYPLNFNVEEITQRFVRGDESRTAEGNGLGLAIAKSYTEICNGTFDIVVDGDMFKAILKFKKYV